MIEEATSCVYMHISPNGKRYVGISIDPIKRWRGGKGYEKNQDFYADILRYGWENILHIILVDGVPIAEAKKIETRLIKELELQDPDKGYNIRDGGNGAMLQRSREKMSRARMGKNYCVGRVLNQESKEKISWSLKKYYLTHDGPMRGRRLSEEQKEHLRQRPVSEKTRKRMSENHANFSGANNPSAKAVDQLTVDGNLVKCYDFAKLAAVELGLDLSSIIKCCRGKSKTVGGYVWKYHITEE